MLKKVLFPLFCWALFTASLNADSPFESAQSAYSDTPINRVLLAHWKKQSLTPPAMASDAVFLRRLALTATGRLPSVAEVQRFAKDKRLDKRAIWIDQVLASPEYADMQAMRFADIPE